MQPFKKVIFIGAALLLIAVLFTTAQADYLGPNRVIVTYETIYQRQACRFVDVRDPAGPGVCACTMTVYVGPKDSCPGSVDSHYFHTNVCGWSSENPDCTDAGLDSISGPSSSIQSCSLGDQACTAVVIEHRTTLASATVSGAITCSTPGQNGWCVGPAVLNVSGSEPLSGYSILTIEGTRNGESFACPGASCSNVPLSEGSNDFQFWAISSYGDSSAMASASGSVDTQAPTISGSLSGTSGENGWYTSAVTLSAAATDPTPGSGIASFEVSADGDAWQPFSGSLTLSDGVHTVSLRTADAAGWTASAEQTFSVDTQVPQLSADLAGHLVSSGRYNTTATLSASGSDTGSGLNRIEYQDNSGGWTTYTDPLVFYNGQHEIEVRAVDQAGLTSDVQTFSFFVESRGPYITIPDHWQVGQTISLSVQANSFSLGSVSIVVSDPQQRWPDVEQVYPAAGDSFTTDFHWDGQFNGQTAPAGQYTVSVYASDVMSNLSVSHSQVTVPVVIPTAVPTLTATGTVAAAESTAAVTVTAQPSSTPTAVVAGVPVTSFSSPASPVTQPAATLPSNVLWGGAAAAVIGAATAAALEAARKRKEEEEAQRKAAEAAAAQFNAAEKVIDAQIAANQDSQWLMQQWLASQGLPTSYPTQAALVAAYDAAREAEKQKAEAQNVTADSGAGNEQNTTAAPTEKEIKQWYSDAYLKNAKEYIEPDQLTLEQWQELIKEFNDLQVHSGRDLYLIPEPDLLSLAKPLPESSPKTEVCAVNGNTTASKSGDVALTLTKPEIVPMPSISIPSSPINSSGTTDKHDSDTWWGKTLNWVDNHQVAVSIGIGIAAGVIVVATGGLGLPLAAAMLVGVGAAAGIAAGGTIALNSYYERNLTQNLIRNTILAGSTAYIAGMTPTAITWTARNITVLAQAYWGVSFLTKIAPPLIGTLTAAATMLGLEAFNYGAAENLDPTISDEEKETAKEVGNLGAAVAMAGMSVMQAAAIAPNSSKTSTEANEGNQPAGEKTLIKDLVLPKKPLDLTNNLPEEISLQYTEATSAAQRIVDLHPTSAGDLEQPEIQEMISVIAENSIVKVGNPQYLVTGKDAGFTNGYIGFANNHDGYYYHTCKGVSELINTLPAEVREPLYEMINKQAVSPFLQQEFPVVTTLADIPLDKAKRIEYALKEIANGNFYDARQLFQGEPFPFMLREAEWIKQAGYTGTFDPINQIFNWVLNK